MKRLCYVLAICVMFCFVGSTVYAETKIGADWFYGKDAYVLDDWQSPSCANTVNRLSFRYETNELFPSLENLFIGGEFRYSRYKADELPGGCYYSEHPGHDAGFIDHGLNLTFRYEIADVFYVGWFMGMSYWLDRDHGMHNLGGSHWLGTWGPMIGKDWKIYKSWSVRTELRISHMSDPWESDRGKNHGEIGIGITYTF